MVDAMNNHKDEAFRALQEEWYAKLKSTGFKDIEAWPSKDDGDLEANYLVDHGGRSREVVKHGETTQGAELFVVLGRYFHEARFPRLRERVYALLYVNGWKGSEIARLFPKTSAKTVNTYLAEFREAALAAGLQHD